ncbi:MAG: sigma 54-interacting transcriptional regulator [Myxococcales bacterium]|nr:sigma 54-interacting transcriptional regulator [Myxococcales bacterium]
MTLHRDPGDHAPSFHGILSAAPAMLEVFETVRRLARTDTPALVRGESGTGKELVARALHQLSRRADAPLEAVNCATLAPELAASTLFGHVRGAFTGAVAPRVGLFKAADGGSVFLDEIAELPSDVQAQLLRVLQERTFTPVGATRPVTVDVRLIAATLRSLREAVAAGDFREDLMYRVRVVPIYLPPLVERDGDVMLLTWHFVRAFNAEMGRAVTALQSDAVEALHAYGWPGNIRELRNAIEHAFIMSDGDTIAARHLPMELRGEGPPERFVGPRYERFHGAATHGIGDDEREFAAAPMARRGEGAEAVKIRAALAEHGSRDAAAAALGMSRTTLWRKMRELGITR